jgi:SPP1 family predicted phage head-tail adaptor
MTVAGELNQRIYLQERLPTQNSLREQSKAWTMFAPTARGLWAKPYTPRGHEFFAAGQEQFISEIVFRIRARNDVTNKMRVLWKGQPYDIGAVNPVQGGTEFIDLACRAGVRDGRMA